MKKITILASIGAVAAVAAAQTDVSPDVLMEEARRQARSVHLQYELPAGSVRRMTADVTVRDTVPGTYFCALAFNGGYVGMQDLPSGERVAIFSVWDTEDPFDFKTREADVHMDRRAHVLYSGPGVRVKRFEGEGTGAQTMMPFAWKVGETYTFTVESEPDGDGRTVFTAYCRMPGGEDFKIATLSTCGRGGDPNLAGVMSFVEDFIRNGESVKHIRRADFTRICAGTSSVSHAVFTGDRNPAKTVDAGSVPEGFFLQTGGSTMNVHAPLWSRVRAGY